MLSIAECLVKENEVDVFWDNPEILNEASIRFNLDLSKVKTVENIFSNKYSTLDRILKTFPYDKIIYLSDGSLPFILPGKLIVHFQQPIKKENAPLSQRVKILQASKVICNSLFTKSFIDKTYGIKSSLLYPPAQKVEQGNAVKKNIILTVGRFHPYTKGGDFKKLEFMINAFKKINVDYKDWEFEIVTTVREQDEEIFKERIESKVNKNIKITKNADYKTVSDSYRKAKIYWHAAGYEEDTDKYPERAEHFGMSTVESMSAGCIPIVINLGGQREIVENNYNGFLWNDADELLTSTIKVISDQTLSDLLSKNAVDTYKKFSKDKFCKTLKEIINP